MMCSKRFRRVVIEICPRGPTTNRNILHTDETLNRSTRTSANRGRSKALIENLSEKFTHGTGIEPATLRATVVRRAQSTGPPWLVDLAFDSCLLASVCALCDRARTTQRGANPSQWQSVPFKGSWRGDHLSTPAHMVPRLPIQLLSRRC